MATLSHKISIYLRSSGASLLSTAVNKAAGFASIWLLNQILTKGAYGNYEFAFTIVSLLLLVGSGGLNHAVMYRLSRLDTPPEEMDGHDFAGAALGWSLIVSCVFTTGVVLGAPYIEMLAGNEDLAFWISLLAFLIPTRVARGVYQSWYKARQCIPEAIIMGNVFPTIGKVLLLVGVWVGWPTPEGVVLAVLVSELIPTLVWYVRTPVNPLNLTGHLSRWDVGYAAKLAVTQGLGRTLRNADVLMVGFLTVAERTAEYVVAAKIALLLGVGHAILARVLHPRIGRFLSQKRWESLFREYDQTRSIALAFALGGACVLALVGETVLGIFGDYSAAYPILIVLAANRVAAVSYGMCDGYLSIAGYAGWRLMATMSILTLNLFLNYLLISVYGAMGAAVATLISYLLIKSLVVYVIYRLDGVMVYSAGLAVVTACVILICGALAFGAVSSFVAAGALAAVLGAFLYRKRTQLLALVEVMNRVRATN